MAADSHTPTNPHAPTYLRARWKALIVFIASLLASLVSMALDNRWPTLFSSFAGDLIGAALPYFVVGMLGAVFVRGWRGVATGVVVVIIFAGFADSSIIRDRREREAQEQPKRDMLNALSQNQQAMIAASREQLARSGHVDVDPAALRETLGDLSARSKTVDPQTALAVDALVKVTNQMMKPAEESRAITAEMATDEFQNPIHYKSPADIETRMARIRAFRDAAQRLVDMYPDLDVRLKSELASKGLPPLMIKEFADSYIHGAHLELTVPFARTNVEYGDLLLRKFAILKSQFGAWHQKDSAMIFDDSAALRDWNDITREMFALSERRETLERQLQAAREADAKQ